MARDSQFDGFTHGSLPNVDLDFSCKSNTQGTQPEAVVDIKNDGQWIRLPITKVETRVNKDGPADIVSTSRVDLPVTWGRTPNGDGKIPIYEYVGASEKEEQNEFDLARVFYWNKYNEKYSVEQFGYVASIGPSDQNGTFRFYIYDASDLMKNISVTKTYDEPTAEGVANFVVFDAEYGLSNNSVIPVKGVSTTIPVEQATPAGKFETFDKEVSGWVGENIPLIKASDFNTYELLADGAGGAGAFISKTIFDFVSENDKWLDDALHAGGHKHFRRNRHTLVDVMDWLTDEIGGSWHFEPVDDGVILVVNNGSTDGFEMGRSSYYDGHFDPTELEYISGFNAAEVDIINNTSLEDLKPINYLELNGESADSFLGINTDRNIIGGPLGAPRGHTDKYPHVEVTYPPLLNRTGGKKLGPKPIESGKQTLAEAEQEAVKEFKKRHEDNTDGSIEIRALPTIRPFDYIAAVPVCNSTFDADMSPIQYEVNSVTHRVSAEDAYRTILGVSMALDEEQIIVRSSNVSIETGEESDTTTTTGDDV